MRRSRAHWFVGSVGLVVLLLSMAVGCGQAAPAQQSGTPQVNWVFQTSETTITNPFSVEFVEMTRQIGAKTNGKFNVRLLVAKEIGIDRDEFPQALAKGTIDSAWLYTSVMSGIYPFLGVFDMPYLTTDQTSVFKVDDAIRPMFEEATKSSGYMVIPNSMHAWFPQDILMKDPIPNLADLKGVKIRTWRALDSELIKALGGEPVSMPIAEAYTSMQRGVVNGLNTGPQAMLENSMYETAKAYYAVRLEPGGAWPSVNKAKWDALPADYQKVFQEEAVAAAKRIRDKYDKEVDKQKQGLADKGVKINEPSKAEIDAWRKAAQGIWEPWASKDPKNRQALDLAKKALGIQ